MESSVIVPMPPVAEGCALPWDAPMVDPVVALAAVVAPLAVGSRVPF